MPEPSLISPCRARVADERPSPLRFLTMKIEIHRPDSLRVWGPFPALKEWREDLALLRPGHEYTNAFRQGDWDGMVRPGRFGKDPDWHLSVGRGYLERLVTDFPDADVVLGYEPARVEFDPGRLPSMLRDYQVGGLEAVFGRRWGQMDMATNAGKGAIIALAAKYAAPHPVAILADEVSVFGALEEQLAEWCPDLSVAKVRAGADDPPTERVALVMVKTLHNRLHDASEDRNGKIRYTARPGSWLEWARSIRMLMLDEADLATSATWQRTVRRMAMTDYRIGFSGSFPEPDTVDGRTLEEQMGPTLESVRNRTLIDRGISARPIVEIVPYSPPLPADYEMRGLNGPARRRLVYDVAVVRNDERHALVRSMLSLNDPNVVVVNLIAHGEELDQALPDSVFLHGSHGEEERNEVMQAFRNGDFQNLIVTRIADRGTNLLGKAVGLVLAAGEGSERQTLQRVGRGLRRADGKEFVFLRDVADRGHKYLNRASRKRIGVYRDEGFDITFMKGT